MIISGTFYLERRNQNTHSSKGDEAMRTLEFDVNGQSLSKSKNCDFSGIVPESVGYLKAQFAFSNDWARTVKVAEFRTYASSDPISVPIINNECIVPAKVTGGKAWYVKVIGKIGDVIIPTDNCRVKQEG